MLCLFEGERRQSFPCKWRLHNHVLFQVLFSCTFFKCFPKIAIWHWEFWCWRKHQSISPVRNVGMEFQIEFQRKLIVQDNSWNLLKRNCHYILVGKMRPRDKQWFATSSSENQNQVSQVCYLPQGHTITSASRTREKWHISFQHSSLSLIQHSCCRLHLTAWCTTKTSFYSFQVSIQWFKNSSEYFNKYATAFKRDDPLF